MALRGRRINNLIRLWCLGASGGLHICVLSTSFQKSNIGWTQQPLTERVLKFIIMFSDYTPFFFLQNIKGRLNLRTWMTLKSSVMIFQALSPLQPQWPLWPQQSQWPQWPWQPHFIKKFTQHDAWIMPIVPKWPIPVHFL